MQLQHGFCSVCLHLCRSTKPQFERKYPRRSQPLVSVMHVVAARVAPSHHTLHSSAPVRRSLLLRRKTLRLRHPSTARCALARARHLARKAESRATRGCRSHLFLHPIASRCDSGITHTMQRAQPRAMTRQRFARESATPACVWMREGRERRKGREGKGRRADARHHFPAERHLLLENLHVELL